MFKIIAGDFPKDTNFDVTFGQASLIYGGLFNMTNIALNKNIDHIEILTEENKKKFLRSAGWGLASAAVAGFLTGGIGAIVAGTAGVLTGGNKKEVVFACYLKNGKKFMAKADPKTYQKISALAF
ncbi:hypothetical protein SDC9_05965 [bioreactor metagenome]|uniref:Uncharacterized protein n=1 Tax=bioreactor metagenome TaxID=1076179 RepID=A0A644T0N1_9ZZZZ|nr:hypothetical protein [Negativicutes bacterium]